MQKTVFISILSLVALCLSACNLGADAIEEPTQVILQPTAIVVTRDDPTEQATNTPIPTQQVVATANNCSPRTDWSTYTVVSGDTLSRIAVRGSTTVDTLVSGNCLSNANLISPGQVLRVPFAVIAPSPIVITSTPVPQTSTACHITMTGERYVWYDQTYLSFGRLANTGETYIITGHNTWNYRIQLTASQDGWLQKSIPEQPTGNCGNVPEVDLFYHEMGGTNNNICYFIPDGSDFNVYLDQALTNQDFTLSGSRYYMVDAQAYNQYRIVSGRDVPYPAMGSVKSRRITGVLCEYS